MVTNRETPPFLKLSNATVMRAGRSILEVGSFSLAEGESVALLGPNGSGKSTFVKLITREVLPLHRDEPPVRFRGNPRAALSEVKACVGVVSSSMQDQITVHLRAIDVVAGGLYGSLGMPARAARPNEARGRALASMSLIGIADLADRDIMTLSTGQARRVLVARALVHDPCMLVFDEPCTGLDPEGMYYVRSSMRALARAGKGIVLVTHYPEDIIPEIDRVVLLKDGRVRADGTKRALITDEVMSDLFEVPLLVRREVVATSATRDPSGTATKRRARAVLDSGLDAVSDNVARGLSNPFAGTAHRASLNALEGASDVASVVPGATPTDTSGAAPDAESDAEPVFGNAMTSWMDDLPAAQGALAAPGAASDVSEPYREEEYFSLVSAC